uniref:Ephrin-A1 n=1 Tax=Oncorhynchus mykiss TaxID=8022 RepID=A0A8C7TMF5_ONCMY
IDLVWLVCLAVSFGTWFASAERHSVFWNSTNPNFLWDEYTVEVKINDYLDIICPHYTRGDLPSQEAERYVLYMVEKEDYEVCKPHSFDQLRWECSRPFAAHAPERFSEKFQRFTPFTLGKEFRQGESYYYISKPLHHHGQECLRLKVDVVGPHGELHSPVSVNMLALASVNDPTVLEPKVQKSVGSSGVQLVSLSVFFTLFPVLLSLLLY